MYRIVRKEALRPTVTLYEIEAPLIAKKAQPGQFIILRVDENGERIPITINNYDPEKGTVTIIVQTVGATTEKLSHLNEGDYLQDFVGPLGKAPVAEGMKKVCVIGGGLGCATVEIGPDAIHLKDWHVRWNKLAYDVTMKDWRTHDGIDISTDAGAVVRAAADGTVESIKQDDLYGTTVVIKHGGGIKTVYSNLAETPTVSEGDSVRAGDVIGSVGESALCEIGQPAHLHFAMSVDGVSVDPDSYLPPQ